MMTGAHGVAPPLGPGVVQGDDGMVLVHLCPRSGVRIWVPPGTAWTCPSCSRLKEDKRVVRELRAKLKTLGTRWGGGGGTDSQDETCAYCGKHRPRTNWHREAGHPRMCDTCYQQGRDWEEPMAYSTCRWGCGQKFGPTRIRKHENECAKRPGAKAAASAAEDRSSPVQSDEARIEAFKTEARVAKEKLAAIQNDFREASKEVDRLREVIAHLEEDAKLHEGCLVCAMKPHERAALLKAVVANLSDETREFLNKEIVIPALVGAVQKGLVPSGAGKVVDPRRDDE